MFHLSDSAIDDAGVSRVDQELVAAPDHGCVIVDSVTVSVPAGETGVFILKSATPLIEAEETITITSSTNPTYGGRIDFDGGAHTRQNLNINEPRAQADDPELSRVFAFFDLSTDPTSGGTITKVELLATVNSVSGTHDLIAVSGPSNSGGSAGGAGPGVDPTTLDDGSLYLQCGTNGDYPHIVTPITTSVGALSVDLGVNGIDDVIAGISANAGFFAGLLLNDEGTAGSVVFDATVGFGLRITFQRQTKTQIFPTISIDGA